VSPKPISIPLGPFRIFSKIRGDIPELMFIAGVNDTGEKLFSGVNDTGEKFIAGVNDTGEYRVLPILACQHLKIKNKQKLNL
jgi:hypothetical protein